MKFRLVEAIDESYNLKSITDKVAAEVAKYDENDSNQNCLLATWATELQLRGEDFLPRPVYSPRDPIFNIKGEQLVKNPERIKIKDKQDVEDKVKAAGNGARFYCHVNWAGSKGGHEFLVINDNNNVLVVDGQVSYIEDIQKDNTYFNDINFENSYIVRLDNKEINQEVLKLNAEDQIVQWDDELDQAFLKGEKEVTESLEKFESGEAKLLFIVGLSASGKTTLANKLGDKYSAEVVNLDKFDIEYNTDNYIKSKDIPNIIEQFTNEVGIVEQGNINIEKFMSWIVEQKLNQPVIVEGVQLLSFPETIKDFPIIVLDLPIETLIKQQLDRNEGNWETIIINDKQFDNYKDWEAALIDSYKEQQKELNDFIAKTNNQKSNLGEDINSYIRFEVKDDKGKNIGGLFRGLNKLLKDLWEDDNYLYDELNEPLSELEYLTIYPDSITDSKTKFAYTQDFYYEYKELFSDIEYVLNVLKWELIMISLDRPNNIVYEDENQIAYI